MKSFNSFSMAFAAALMIGGVMAPGCAQDDAAAITAVAADSLAAGPQAQARYGVAHYKVKLNPTADGNHVVVELVGADGAHLGEVTAYHEASGASVLRLTADGVVTDIVTDADTMQITRDGGVRYSLERSQVEASSGLADLDGKAPPMPEDLVSAVGLAGAVVTDSVLVDYVASVSPAGTAYLVKDCPWWVTAAACAGWETGVGGFMCVACGLSYLL